LADPQAVALELDELVHDGKGDEAAEVNNGGIESQLRYLLGLGLSRVSSDTIKQYCELLEIPLPGRGAAATALLDDDWTDDDQQAAYQDGWGLFETGGGLELMALDDPDEVAETSGNVPRPRFEGPNRDAQAEDHVRRRAAEGSLLAQKAIAALEWDRDRRRRHPPADSDLARAVYEAVLSGTASFDADRIGTDLAYLMGAILTGSQCQWTGDRPLVGLLRQHFTPQHALWRYIEIQAE
jgi:hypothetical protein